MAGHEVCGSQKEGIFAGALELVQELKRNTSLLTISAYHFLTVVPLPGSCEQELLL